MAYYWHCNLGWTAVQFRLNRTTIQTDLQSEIGLFDEIEQVE